MNRMLRSAALAAALALTFAGASFAHGGHDHVMGTVKSVDAKARTIEVDGRYGKRATVAFDDNTKFLRGDAAATAADLVTGVRVVIDASTVDGKQVAKEIKLGPAPK
jgi:class 3 adenylate cyclase